MLNNIVDNIEQCYVGSTALFKAVFINPEQVVHFYACILMPRVQTYRSWIPNVNPDHIQ